MSASARMEENNAQTQQTLKHKRGKWARKLEYVLSVLGFIVGFGNIWRFPYICMVNGGGAFLIPYLILLFLCGLPVFFIESVLGQFTAKPVNKVWGICPLFGGIGVGMMILQINSTVYYNSLLGWVLYYMYNSFKSPLPWSLCRNEWNTEFCMARSQRTSISHQTHMNATYNSTFAYNGTIANVSASVFNQTSSKFKNPAEEFWRNHVIQASSGLSDVGGLIDHASVATLLSCVIVLLCILRGVKTVGKVVYVTALLPYLLLVVIFIRGLTLPGSLDGIIFYLKPDFNKLADVQVWIQAAVQVFYSLGPGWGCLITMSSYNKFHNNCFRDSIVLALAGEGTSVFGGLVIFSVLGFMAHEANVPVSKVVQSGPGLGLIAYPEALSQLPLPNAWAFIFFLAMFTVGLDSTFATLESFLDGLLDVFQIPRKRHLLFRAGAMAIFYLLNLLYCTKTVIAVAEVTGPTKGFYKQAAMMTWGPFFFFGGIYLYQLTDWYCAAVGNITFVILECLIVGWLYGTERFSSDIELMIGRRPPLFIRICWCFVTPLILLALMFFLFATYKPPTYGDYHYPRYAEVIGWIFAFSPLVPIIVVAFRTLVKSPGKTLKEKLTWSIKPSKDWVPASDASTKAAYIKDYSTGEERMSLVQRIKYNAVGRKI